MHQTSKKLTNLKDIKTSKDCYKNISHLYDQDNHRVYIRTRKWTNKIIKNKANLNLSEIKNVLEIGVGTGKSLENRILNLKFNKDTHFTCLDLSENMLKVAGKRLSSHNYNFEFIPSNAMDIDISLVGRKYDLIICEYVLSYVKEPFLEKAKNLLSKNGKLIIITTTQKTGEKTAKLFYNNIHQMNLFEFPGIKKWLSRDNFEKYLELCMLQKDHNTYIKYFNKSAFKINYSENIDFEVRFNGFKDAWKYMYNDGWLVASFPSTKKAVVGLIYIIMKYIFNYLSEKDETFFPSTDYVNVSTFIMSKK